MPLRTRSLMLQTVLKGWTGFKSPNGVAPFLKEKLPNSKPFLRLDSEFSGKELSSPQGRKEVRDSRSSRQGAGLRCILGGTGPALLLLAIVIAGFGCSNSSAGSRKPKVEGGASESVWVK